MDNVIFLFSQPRAGSTLLQRLLMTHSKVASANEPWVLLPLAALTGDLKASASFNFTHAQYAMQDFTARLPQGRVDVWEEIGRFVTRLYSRAAGEGCQYFLDKTPRYYLIIEQIAAAFPRAKFVFLFRNPLAVLASIIRTWWHNRLAFLHLNNIDLFEAPQHLVTGWQYMRSRAIRIQYEDLVTYPEDTLNSVWEYLEVDPPPGMEPVGVDELPGRFGDKTGAMASAGIASGGIERWKNVFNTRARQRFAARYLRHLGPDISEQMGYDPKALLDEVNNLDLRGGMGVRDTIDLLRGSLYRYMSAGRPCSVLARAVLPSVPGRGESR